MFLFCVVLKIQRDDNFKFGQTLLINSPKVPLRKTLLKLFDFRSREKKHLSRWYLKDFGTFCNTKLKHNVHGFTLNLHSLKIVIVESFPENITC